MKKYTIGLSLLAVSLLGLSVSAAEKKASSAEDERILKECKALYKSSKQTHEERMQWWEDGRFGMFIHWGAYSQLAGMWKGEPVVGYAEHIQRKMLISNEVYLKEAVQKFNPVKFDADQWVQLCKSAGMKYLVITSKHHDGFAMWHSKNPYNIVDATPFKRDPLAELRDACKRQGIKFCVYYSHAQEWNHPGGQRNLVDYPNNPRQKGQWFKMPRYEDHLPLTRQYVDEKSIPQMLEIIEDLQPDLIWFDTSSWLPPEEINRIYLACRKADPNVIISGRIGQNWHDYISTCDKPAAFPPSGQRYWEAIPTTNESYGYHREDHSHKPGSHFVELLIGCVAKGGNLLLNVGPKPDGTIADVDYTILGKVGEWVQLNKEAIYGCGKSVLPSQSWGYVTQPINVPATRVYLLIKDWPKDGKLVVSGLSDLPETITALVDSEQRFIASALPSGQVSIQLPEKALQAPFTTLRLDFAKPIEEGSKARFLQENLEVNTLHVFDDATRIGSLGFAQGHKDDEHITRWDSSEDGVKWDVQTAQKSKWVLSIEYQAKAYKGRFPSEITKEHLEELSTITAIVTIDGHSYECALKGSNPNEHGYADDVVATVEIPAGNHTVEVSAKGVSEDLLFYLKAVNFRPVE